MSSQEKIPWIVVIAGPAQKSLNRAPARDRSRLLAAIENMQRDPLGGDVRKLQGGLQGFRRRVGNWRVFFDLYPSTSRIVITAILRRTSTTY